MALSDTTVRQAKTTGKAYTIGDTDGLSLAVSPIGNKSWHFRYVWNGVQKRLSLGTYPEISLKDARTRRDDARELVARGINPKKHRNQERRLALLAEEHTFQKLFEHWFEFRKLSLKEGRQSTQAQIQRIFRKDLLPKLGLQSVYDIKRPDLLEVIEVIERRGAFTTAEKCRTWLHQMFRYVLIKVPDLEQSPASDLDVVAAPKPPVKHNPFLRMGELPELLQKLRQYRGMLQTQLGLRLLLLTGVRTGELRLATPDQFHLDQGLWIIPPEVVKQLQLEMRKERIEPTSIPPYIVPLSAQAQEIVRYLLEQRKPAQKHLLSHRSELAERISENTLNTALRRMGYVRLLTGHGIRATISTALNEIGYPKVWVDAQLSHTDPDKVSASYNHAEYVEQRRRMMQDWADRLDMWEQGLSEAASMHLSHTVQFDSMPLVPNAMADVPSPDRQPVAPGELGATISSVPATASLRLPAVPVQEQPPVPVEPAPSQFQREHAEKLELYEASHNLPVVAFAKLAGKSRDQVNRDIKAGRLLTLAMGNRGQRIPDWQLDPLCRELTSLVLSNARSADPWRVYHALNTPVDELGGMRPIEAVRAYGVEKLASEAGKMLEVLTA
ncbi:integrase arm-type DNA-binding domain-containing protein [Serratia nevei]|uniref:tyrosine-type recombinase/integrase n=1 Tax=Serratia nevei TaxID=2703794 RepID=UPI00209C7DB0|nr:integrase arm-type DNA-binding domain-containing protein [Serratia nevei]MCP1106549.1 integrase arm-type DNA-binding domain-containing protein [Serratia nevei]